MSYIAQIFAFCTGDTDSGEESLFFFSLMVSELSHSHLTYLPLSY